MLPLFVGSFALNFWLSDEMHFGGSWEVWKKSLPCVSARHYFDSLSFVFPV